MNIVSRVGTPIDVDVSTKKLSRGTFARVCIEINLSQLLVSGVPVEIKGEPEFWQELVYERIGVYCFQCGRIGHRCSSCTYHIAGEVHIAPVDGLDGTLLSQPKQRTPHVDPVSSHASGDGMPTTIPPNSSSPVNMFGPWLV